jgi:ADP-heptose:LPS heptosyltransferase
MTIRAKPWTKKTLPKRVLAIRLQAMGDVMGALPYLQDLRNNLPPSVELDLLTREETDGMARQLVLFNRVISIGGKRNHKKQLLHTLFLLPALLLRRYDVVIDLQNNDISGLVRRVLLPPAWSVFDKYSPVHGGQRYRCTIEAAGLGPATLAAHFQLKDPGLGRRLLVNAGWKEGEPLVLLNPAGAFETRNWEIEKYIDFARLWLGDFPRTRFLVLGTDQIANKAASLQAQLGDRLINLVGTTTPGEAFAILQQVTLALSEDSGLMHMAWTSGVPTMALFGSTRTDWARPLGDHSFYLDSSDLPCGNCMLSVCRYGDNRCMTRHTPEEIYRHCLSLIQKVSAHGKTPVS